MPYIPVRLRQILDDTRLEDIKTKDPGELNYCITKLILDGLGQHEFTSYKVYNELMGVLESAKLEFYRRKVAPYEDERISDRGDVY